MLQSSLVGRLDIVSAQTGEELAEAEADGETSVEAPADTAAGTDDETIEGESATTTKPDVEEVLKEAEETQDRDACGDFEENEADTPEEAEEQLAEAEAIKESGEAEVEVAEMADSNMTDGLESQDKLPDEDNLPGETEK